MRKNMMVSYIVRAMAIVCGVGLLSACGGGGGASFGGGISGTGKPTFRVGVIEQDGSVIVDGVTFDATSAVITVSGGPVGEADLRAGMVAAVEGNIDSTTGAASASSVVIEEVLKGPISSKVDGTTFVVLGQLVEITSTTVFESGISPASLAGLAIDDFVEVYGFYRSPGEVTATRIEREGTPSELRIVGSIESHDAIAMTFFVGAQLVDYATADTTDLPGGLPANGLIVEVRGDLPLGGSGELTANRVELDDDGPPSDIDDASVEGFVTSISSPTAFDVDSQPVEVTGATVFEGGTADDVLLGTKVEAEGPIVGGILMANRIEFADPVKLESDIATVAGSTITLVGLPGITIDTNAATSYDGNASAFADLSIGDHVQVRGRISGATAVLATSIDEDDPNTEVELQGPVDTSPPPSDPTLSILGVSVDTSGLNDADFEDVDETILGRTAFFAATSPTTLVKVSGTLSGSVVTWEEASLEE